MTQKGTKCLSIAFSQKNTEKCLLLRTLQREKTFKIAVLIEEKPDILTQQMVGMEETQVRSQT